MLLNKILVILYISPSLRYLNNPDTTILDLYEALLNQFMETGVCAYTTKLIFGFRLIAYNLQSAADSFTAIITGLSANIS